MSSGPSSTLDPLGDAPLNSGALRPGTMIGEYRVVQKLGNGTFGEVYLATHPIIEKVVAIKVLNAHFSHQPEMLARFIDEARAVNQIRHPNIVDIFAFAMLPDGRAYFVMEHLDGVSVDEYLVQKGALPVHVALPLLADVARALQAAHQAGIVHRDLKAENIVLARDSERGLVPKLLDFGIAKLMGRELDYETQSGAPMGTPDYMSPEQCQGQDVDHRSDVYSFGVLTHLVLTGRLPFAAVSPLMLMSLHITEPPPPMSAHSSVLPTELDGPVLRMLAKNRDERPASVLAALRDLATAAAAVGYAVPPQLVTATTPAALPRIQEGEQSQPTNAPLAATNRPTSDAQRKWTGWILALGIALLFLIAIRQSYKPAPAVDPRRATSTTGAASESSAVPVKTGALPPGPTPPTEARALEAASRRTLQIRLSSVPSGVDVFRGHESLGKTPLVVELNEHEPPTAFRFLAYGYDEGILRVSPTGSGAYELRLRKTSAPKPHERPRPHRSQLDF